MSDLIAIGIFVAGFFYLSNKDLKERAKIREEAIKRWEEIYKD